MTMAFNPFRAFRKHKRAIFAGLVIVSMITFVGISGGVSGAGDAFFELQRLFVGTGRYTKVATLYGSKVDIHDIDLLRRQRQIANDYMLRAVSLAQGLIIDEVRKDLYKTPSEYDE